MNQSLKQLGTQLIEIWKQLGLNQRISVVLAFGVVVLGLSALAFFSSRQDFELLSAQLDSSGAAEVMAYLEEKKIPYKTGNGGNLIYVPRSQVGTIRVQFGTKISGGGIVGDEILENPNVMLSDAMQKAQLQRAQNGELARMVSSIEDIDSARVRVSVPSTRLLIRSNDEHPSASVLVKVRGGRVLSRQSVQSISAIVANAVEGLRPNQVSVSDTAGNLYTDDYEQGSAAGIADKHFAIRQQVENVFAKKAKSMLDSVLGPGQSTVRVAVELNTDSITSTERKINPETKVERQKTETEETTTSNTGGTTDAPGIAINSNLSTNVAAGSSMNSTDSKITKSEVTNEFDESVRQIVQMAGGVKRISAAVMVNTRYEGLGAERKAIQRSPAEMDQLKEIVQSALGIQTEVGGDRTDTISMMEISFNDQPLIEMTQELEQIEKMDFWMSMGRKIAYPALALVILYMFVRALKKTKLEEIPVGVPVGELDADGQLDPLADWSAGNKPRAVTVDVLNRLVKENPQNMTEALRTWMAGAKNN